MILLVLQSCNSMRSMSVVQSNDTTSFIQRSVSSDTIYLRDSVFVREVQKGDTVYLTRIEWRERWRTQIMHDTIRNTEYIAQVIEKPPVRYVPKFYKWCTVALWAVLGVLVVVVVLKVRLRGVR
jgi:hypothetical protein